MAPLCGGRLRISSEPCSLGGPMLDLILLALGLGFFALMAAYTAGCDRV
jgi:hypothetical protein